MKRKASMHQRRLHPRHDFPSPHALGYSRRQFMARTGRLALGAGAAAGLIAGGQYKFAAAQEDLPEIPEIPDSLTGSGEVRVVSWGGAFQEAQRQAYFQPFQEMSGIKVVEAEGPSSAAVKAQVDTGNIEWDVVQVPRSTVYELAAQGDYWEPINYDLVDTENIDEAFRYELAMDMLPYGQIYAYRTDVYTDAQPSGWADFWDTETFPGPRTLPGAGTVTPDLQAAVMAAGVPPEEVYPIDIDLAFESFEQIRDDVVKWWEAGAEPAQMLADQEVDMALAWNGRIAAIQEDGAPVEIAWEQGSLRSDAWAVLKDTPNLENAMKFIAFTTLPVPQARLSMLIPYGFVNEEAAQHIPEERLSTLPTAPEIRDKLIVYNEEWWAENRAEVIERFNEFVLG